MNHMAIVAWIMSMGGLASFYLLACHVREMSQRIERLERRPPRRLFGPES